MDALRHWWLCPECLNAFETPEEGRGHWADDEGQAVCDGPLTEVVPSTDSRGGVEALDALIEAGKGLVAHDGHLIGTARLDAWIEAVKVARTVRGR